MREPIRWLSGWLACSFGMAFICHAWHLTIGGAPRRWQWLLALVVSTIVLQPLFQRWWRSIIPMPRPQGLIVLLAATFTHFASYFRFTWLGDNLWIFPNSLQSGLRILLHAADITVWAVIFTTFLHLTVDRSTERPTIDRPRFPWLGLGVAVVAINAMILAYALNERTIYSWDYSTYWLISGDYAARWRSDPLSIVPRLGESLAFEEYNGLPSLLPSLGMAAFGDTRLPYLLLIGNIYGIAVAVALWYAIGRASAWPILLVALCPILWMPTVRGYLDFGGVAIALLILARYFHRRIQELTWADILIIGVGLTMLALFRRWYSFWVVSFALLAGCEAMLALVRQRSLSGLRHLIGIGGVAGFSLLALAWPMVQSIARSNYAGAYSAYRIPGSELERLHQLCSDSGYVHVLLLVVSAIIVIADRSTRRAGLFALALIPLIHVQFHRLQDMGFHQRLLYAPSYLYLVGMAGCSVITRLRLGGGITIGLTLLNGIILGWSLCPALDATRAQLAPFAPASPIHPMMRYDVDTLLQLANDAQTLADERSTSFGVIASSPIINATAFNSIHRALGVEPPSPWRQVVMTEVDKVGGFPDGLYDAGVLIVAGPPQLHLRPSEQQIVEILATDLLSGRGIGAAYRKLPNWYMLNDRVRAAIFIREREIRVDEWQSFSDRLREAHPEFPRVWQPTR